eukprot:TRINITY_DN4133_c0_g1_i1.p1 TRINITY_DN4133_c0_g1~~TRINITY_DN4133_c0_g1_i1.p1  ORF type:complete len:157 (+),score=1.29 TRINITY_DN4133_c0_g1_i1:1343-1813(+)
MVQLNNLSTCPQLSMVNNVNSLNITSIMNILSQHVKMMKMEAKYISTQLYTQPANHLPVDHIIPQLNMSLVYMPSKIYLWLLMLIKIPMLSVDKVDLSSMLSIIILINLKSLINSNSSIVMIYKLPMIGLEDPSSSVMLISPSAIKLISTESSSQN